MLPEAAPESPGRYTQPASWDTVPVLFLPPGNLLSGGAIRLETEGSLPREKRKGRSYPFLGSKLHTARYGGFCWLAGLPVSGNRKLTKAESWETSERKCPGTTGKAKPQKQAHGCPGHVLPPPCHWWTQGSPPGLLDPLLGTTQGGGSREVTGRMGRIGPRLLQRETSPPPSKTS